MFDQYSATARNGFTQTPPGSPAYSSRWLILSHNIIEADKNKDAIETSISFTSLHPNAHLFILLNNILRPSHPWVLTEAQMHFPLKEMHQKMNGKKKKTTMALD